MAVGEANMIIQGLPYKQNLELQRGGRWICQKSDLFFFIRGRPIQGHCNILISERYTGMV